MGMKFYEVFVFQFVRIPTSGQQFQLSVCLFQSEAIGNAAYKCRWYQVERGGDAMFRKDLIPVIVRAQKPMVLMAWKFWPITIKTFGMVSLARR